MGILTPILLKGVTDGGLHSLSPNLKWGALDGILLRILEDAI